MDLFKIAETKVKISQFTWLKQAGMEIENRPWCYWLISYCRINASVNQVRIGSSNGLLPNRHETII